MPTRRATSMGRPTIPVVAHPRLARSRLVARLTQLPPGGVALLVAPAGYGATSLLALAAEESNATPVWLSGPRGQAGYRQFWISLAEALSRVGVEAPVPPEEDGPDAWQEFGSDLGRRLAAGPALLLVVDDLGGDSAFDAVFQHLVDNLPTNVRLLVRVRRTPHLDVSRVLAAGQLVLLDRWDLSLSPEESGEYLEMIAPDLSADRRTALTGVAEGWIGALRASITGTGGSPDTDPAAWLLGSGLELLFGRWLATLDPVDRDLLVRCSVLDTLTPEACDWIVERSDSAVRLAGLSEAQVVAPPVGALGFQYRPHGLLQEYLRRQLSARGRPAVAQAHQSAGLWLASRGDVDSAVTHLLDAGQVDKAREVLGDHVAGLLDSGRSDRVRGWYRQAPELALPEDQLMLLGAAWAEVLGGNVAAARPHLAELEAITAAPTPGAPSGQGDGASGVVWLRTETLFLRTYLEAWAGHTGRARELVRKVRAAYGNDWHRTSPQAAALMGVRLDLWHGDDEAARSELLALSTRPRTNEYYRAVAIPALGALLAADDGRAHRARFLADAALAALEETGAIGAADDCDARLARARALVDLGDSAAALREASEVEARGASVGHVGYLVLGAVARARALVAGSDWPGAGQALEEARQVLRERAGGNGLVQVIDCAAVEVAVETSDRARANRALERIPSGRARDRLAIRVAGMGGSLTEVEAVRLARSARPVAPREVVDARLLMAAVTAASRPAEAEMHLSAAATIAYELGMLRVLTGRSEEVLVLAHRIAQRAHEQPLAALVAAVAGSATPSTPTLPTLSRGERELLDRLATSEGHRELAADLGISVNTLKTRLRRLYAKLGVHDRASALRRTGSGV
jgi:LuxR family maltose regulon positive regulatory protein